MDHLERDSSRVITSSVASSVDSGVSSSGEESDALQMLLLRHNSQASSSSVPQLSGLILSPERPSSTDTTNSCQKEEER